MNAEFDDNLLLANQRGLNKYICVLILIGTTLIAAITVLILTPFTVKAATSADEPFTIAVIPDSQNSPQKLQSQTTWLANNSDDLNLKFVIHEGDLVNDMCDNNQWAGVDSALKILETANIGYAISPGNHDVIRYDNCLQLDQQRYYDYSQWNKWLPLSRISGVKNYGGSMNGSSANTWWSFTTSDKEFVVLALEFGPNQATLDWANQIVSEHKNAHVLLVTHDMIGPDGKLRGTASVAGPSANKSAQPSISGQLGGQDIWSKLVNPNKNVVMTFNGHVADCVGGVANCNSTTGVVGRSIANNASGVPVARMLANYQSMSSTSNTAYIRLLTFFPREGVVQVKTFSPTLNMFLTDSANQFYIDAPWLSGRSAAQPFSDSGAFETETTVLRSLKITNGNADGTYRPADNLSRQAAAAMIWRTLPASDPNAKQDCISHGVKSKFKDVSDSNEFCWPIYEMTRMGRITGYDDGTFRPGNAVSRQAFAAFLFDRGGTYKATPFKDVTTDHPFAASIAAVYSSGVVNGYDDGTYRGGSLITRDAAAAMLARYYFWQRFAPDCLRRL